MTRIPMSTIRIPTGTTSASDSRAVPVSRDAVACLAGAAVAAALFVGAPIVAPAPAQAACDNYQFEGGLLQLELDNGYTVQVPATGQTVGPGRVMAANVGRTLATFGDAVGGISGRKIEFKVSYDEGPGSGDYSYFTGQVNDNGRASGNVNSGKLFAGRADTPWHTNRALSCVTAPAAAPPPVVAPPPPSPPVAPFDAIRIDIIRAGFNVNVTVTNTADLAGKCTYVANPTNNPLLPTVKQDFNIGAKGEARLTFLAPPPLSTYHVEVSCHGTFNGQNVEFGHVEDDVSG